MMNKAEKAVTTAEFTVPFTDALLPFSAETVNARRLDFDKPSPALFLKSLPDGAYTCARAHCQITEGNCTGLAKENEQEKAEQSVLLKDFHIQRLLESFNRLFPSKRNLVGPSILSSFIDHLLLKHWGLHKASCKQTFFLTVLVYAAGNSLTLSGHLMTPSIADTYCVPLVLITKLQTSNQNRIGLGAPAKSSVWIQERTPLEGLKNTCSPSASEIIMTDSDGISLLEGLITNVFVVINGVVYTAGSNVLEGHMRYLVLQICKRLNVPLLLTSPKLTSIDDWDEMFLTSTTKPVCQVRQAVIHECGKRKTFSDFTVGSKIQQFLKDTYLDVH
mmetsp:Transcript_2666/g.3604  ORF Transcript_2666/g.3604 Transcript_2666/m.3604 type:complete len:332 (+) Transcript_2666:68-1063(+)